MEDFRREREEKRLQNESQHFDDMLLDLDPALVSPKVIEEQRKLLQQAMFRKKEEEIWRTLGERRRKDNVSNDNAWSNPSYPSNSSGTYESPLSRFNRLHRLEPAGAAGPSTGWGSSTKPNAGKPKTGSVSFGTYPTSSSTHTASFSEAERKRKQQEFAESQQEQFRRVQEKTEAERQLEREELQLVEHHERLWTRLNTLNELSWNDFPWPMDRQPSNPDDMSISNIDVYYLSSILHWHLDGDKSRTPKDRIMENIKRWDPDRFETELLPKVVEDEREKVKHGAGKVARYLRNLL